MRLAAQAKGGFYPTPPRVIDMIAEQISVRPVNSRRRKEPAEYRILDPCAGEGGALASIAQATRNPMHPEWKTTTFGVELNTRRAASAETLLDRTLASDLFNTSIANGMFSGLLLNPPYDNNPDKKRTEHAFLVHCTRYLMADGVLIYIVPQHRLKTSAQYLAANYRTIQCFRFPDPEFDDFDQVILTARRSSQSYQQPEAEQDIMRWSLGLQELDSIEHTSQYNKHLLPPSTPREILFTTRSVDPTTAAIEARRSGLWVSPQVQDLLWPPEQASTIPLMPLRRGHMAMLVAAGFLDNLCLENDDQRILVKGRTNKESILVEQTEDREVYREQLRTTITTLDLKTGLVESIN